MVVVSGLGQPTASEALIRMTEAEETLRAIGAGEVDAFVLSDGGHRRRVFTLSTADRPYRKFVENMRDGAATLSSAGLILYANQRLADLLSCSREMIMGSHLTRFTCDDGGLIQDPSRAPADGTFERELVDAHGRRIPVLVGISPLEAGGDRMTCVTFTDLSAQKSQEREIARLMGAQAERLTELQHAQATLTEQATHDALTGLPNRALLVDRIDQALAHSRRSGRCIAVIFVDLDRFKQVNDSHGHAAGDAELRRVADKLVAAFRPMDTVARIGGDEFVILAPDVDNHLHAAAMSKRLLRDLTRRPDRLGDAERNCAASVGIAISMCGRGTAETLLEEADTAMYHAKSLGGRRAELFDEALGRQVQERLVAEKNLQSALDEGRVFLHYQPLIELSSGQVTGFEGLARIVGTDGALIAPAAFIPTAEETGLVIPLGTTVLGMACNDAARWTQVDGSQRRLSMAVNLSARQFEPGDLVRIVEDQLQQTPLAPGSLHLELTETAIMELKPDTLVQLSALRNLGVEIGLDDFGTGYASLTHLRRLPLSFVKIDRSFVQGLGTEREDDRIVSAVVDLASNLGLRSIGEGVETNAQLEWLRDLGCDQAQGYLFARPSPAEAVPAMLGRRPHG